MRNVSFLMPVRIDGEHRKRHLTFVLGMILNTFDADVFLYEDDIKPLVKDAVPPKLYM